MINIQICKQCKKLFDISTDSELCPLCKYSVEVINEMEDLDERARKFFRTDL